MLLSPNAAPVAALLLWAFGTASLGLLAWTFGRGVRPPGAVLRRDANLIATRPGAQVKYWLVAHLDTKAQGHSMAARLIAVWWVVASLALMLGLAVLRLWSGTKPIDPTLVVAMVAVAVIAGTLAGRGRLKGTTTGARDNGTGLLALLSAIEQTRDPALGVIVTGAEEFGVVGARHLVEAEPALVAGAAVINLDTLCDSGSVYVITHRGSGSALATRVRKILQPLGVSIVQRRLPLGIVTDGVSLARVAGAVVDVSRLDWSVLRLIHTPQDSLDRLDPTFAESLGRSLGQALTGPPG